MKFIEWDVNLRDRYGTKGYHHIAVLAGSEEEAKRQAAQRYPECTVVGVHKRMP